MLLQYAREHHFPNPTFFVDDGVSGVTYDRPGFQAMLAEIEAGRVAVAITKDLSRLGRNSALTGLYTNFTFPQNGVRFIAINDNYDTIDPIPKFTVLLEPLWVSAVFLLLSTGPLLYIINGGPQQCALCTHNKKRTKSQGWPQRVIPGFLSALLCCLTA